MRFILPTLRYAFFACLAAGLAVAAGDVEWFATVKSSTSPRFQVQLESAPLWAPPILPTHAEAVGLFRSGGHSRSPQPSARAAGLGNDQSDLPYGLVNINPMPAYVDRAVRFPEPTDPGFGIERTIHPDWVALKMLLILWPVTIVFGTIYVLVRGGRRDRMMECVASSAAGLTTAAIACVVLWLVIGGWGPPFPLFFACAGIVAGIVYALTVSSRNPASLRQ